MARETASGINGHASHLHPISMLLLRSQADALDCQISEKSPWPPGMVTSSDWRRDRALVDKGATTQRVSRRVSQEEQFTGEIQFLVRVGV